MTPRRVNHSIIVMCNVHVVNSERSPNGAVIGASGSEIIGYKSQPPNNTIMIRGLAQHITENDVSILFHIILCKIGVKTDLHLLS